ncbi:unnamed protein product (macronuclear) [Paramecium tetraurelia]|uniref:Thioredoxin domain-containing protein n=2 Tax=Paramecium TaxID=5884 RepID=A0BLH3_PARTE|nr:uncharacterized protein GSPATT00030023001 [Paramecium tetraurelia]CAD8162358.1 unnamed protein product [Paramecium octaurelia]CAK59390.1 unnamed protein product [Paramecium tetraurelia]|eukprot:XP_001426788.1 hypothetical protein (macronuclear) [Paramecium tetraurelia strain d4-2]
MNCVQINNNQEWKEHVMSCQKPVVVSFFAEWCAPCHKLNPQLIQEAQKNCEKWQLALVNVDNEELYDVVQQIAKAQIPSVHLLNRGTSIDSMTGYSERKTKSFINRVCS